MQPAAPRAPMLEHQLVITRLPLSAPADTIDVADLRISCGYQCITVYSI
jgi:hypothetical protein